MFFDGKALDNKNFRDQTPLKLLEWPAIKVSASGVSPSTRFLSSNPDELCDILEIKLQEKQAGNISNTIDKEIVAKTDKLLEYKCITMKQHSRILKIETFAKQYPFFIKKSTKNTLWVFL